MNDIKASDATTQVARAIKLEESAALMKSQGGTLTAQVQVIRKGTGKVENYMLRMSTKEQ
jgi:hypothetical protein